MDYYADWCMPCKQIAPYLKTLSEEYTKIEFYKVNVDDLEEVTNSEKVTAMPTFKAYKNGKCIGTILGADKSKLKNLVENNQ